MYYYRLEDLGVFSKYLTKDSAAVSWYEDETGFYTESISPVRYCSRMPSAYGLTIEKKLLEQDLMVYFMTYMPKMDYVGVINPFSIPNSKKQPLDPSSIPDSKIKLNPVNSTGNSGSYYYNSDLAAKLEWLAVKIACIGKYDMSYTGDFYTKNPKDYYTTSFIKPYLLKENRTVRGTMTFEGICFDYADFAIRELTNNFNFYSGITVLQIFGWLELFKILMIWLCTELQKIASRRILLLMIPLLLSLNIKT